VNEIGLHLLGGKLHNIEAPLLCLKQTIEALFVGIYTTFLSSFAHLGYIPTFPDP
jgi:hypothetical protein